MLNFIGRVTLYAGCLFEHPHLIRHLFGQAAKYQSTICIDHIFAYYETHLDVEMIIRASLVAVDNNQFNILQSLCDYSLREKLMVPGDPNIDMVNFILNYSAQQNNVSAVRFLLVNYQPNLTDDSILFAFIIAMQEGDLNVAQCLVSTLPRIFDENVVTFGTFQAIEKGHTHLVEWIFRSNHIISETLKLNLLYHIKDPELFITIANFLDYPLTQYHYSNAAIIAIENESREMVVYLLSLPWAEEFIAGYSAHPFQQEQPDLETKNKPEEKVPTLIFTSLNQDNQNSHQPVPNITYEIADKKSRSTTRP